MRTDCLAGTVRLAHCHYCDWADPATIQRLSQQQVTRFDVQDPHDLIGNKEQESAGCKDEEGLT